MSYSDCPQSRNLDSQGQKAFLPPSADAECPNYNPYLSTLMSKGLGCIQMKW